MNPAVVQPSSNNHANNGKNNFLHAVISKPFLFLVPIVFIIITAVGFTRSDYVEEQVSQIWIPQGDQLAKNYEYLDEVGNGRKAFTSSSFAAMALARDGGNLFTPSRLEEIRSRMDAIEALQIDYMDETFTWEDVCARSGLGAGTGTTYKFPCARLSPMDLFQETRSYFQEVDRLTWYHAIVRGAAIRPRVLRFGIMQQACVTPGPSNACDKQAALRLNATFAEAMGYPPEYANPLGLISDVGSLEFNDPCRICIEESLENQMETLHKQLIIPFFTVLSLELQRYQQSLVSSGASSDDIATMELLVNKTQNIAAAVTRKSVEDFFYYQVLRKTYAELGAPSYLKAYNELVTPESLPFDCAVVPCPSFNISLEEAKTALLNHADNTFSSVSTAGTPFPFWSEGDGTGSMFAGFNPVGGSGLDMSAPLLSGVGYLDLPNYGKQDKWNPLYANGFADPLTPDPTWSAMVETNPIYAWFMAEETEMTARKCPVFHLHLSPMYYFMFLTLPSSFFERLRQ